MLSTLKSFLQRLIKRYEGGYVWRKSDPGGPTNYGVTWRALADHLKEKATSEADWAPKVKAMSIDTAIDIYVKKYAPPVHYDEMPLGVDATMMDYGVNSGPARPVRVACTIVGMPGTVLTPAVVEKIKAMPSNIFINKMCDERLAFMKSLKGGKMWAEYGGGWGTRVADLRSYATSLAHGGSIPVAPDLSQVPTPKAVVEKPGKTTPVVSTGVVGAVTTAASSFTSLPWLWIAAAAGLIFAIGFIYVVVQDVRHANEEAKVHI